MMDKFISIEGDRQALPGAERRRRPRCSRISWLGDGSAASSVCVIGHSGCGKTTVLNILAGLDDAVRGRGDRRRAGDRGHQSLDRAVIFQGHALLPWRSVLGKVAYAVTSKWRNWSTAPG